MDMDFKLPSKATHSLGSFSHFKTFQKINPLPRKRQQKCPPSALNWLISTVLQA
jgi:hypothetical protein